MYVKQWGEREQLQNILLFHANTKSFDYFKSSVLKTECPAKIQEDFVPRRMKHCIVTQNVWSTFNSVLVHTIIYLVCICRLRQPENFRKPNSSRFLQDEHLTFQSEWWISIEMYFSTFSLDLILISVDLCESVCQGKLHKWTDKGHRNDAIINVMAGIEKLRAIVYSESGQKALFIIHFFWYCDHL